MVIYQYSILGAIELNQNFNEIDWNIVHLQWQIKNIHIQFTYNDKV